MAQLAGNESRALKGRPDDPLIPLQVTIQSTNDIHQLTGCSQPQIPFELAANQGRCNWTNLLISLKFLIFCIALILQHKPLKKHKFNYEHIILGN